MNHNIHNPVYVLEEFIKISSALSQERDINHLLNQIVTTACQLTGAEMGCLYLLDYTKTYLYPEVVRNTLVASIPDDLPKIFLYSNQNRTENRDNICAYTAFSGKPVNITDVYAYSGFQCEDLYQYDQQKEYYCKSLLAVPMRGYAGFTIGILQLINRRLSDTEDITDFPESIVTLTEAFASQAAVVVDNTRLIAENKQLIKELSLSNQALEKENIELKQKVASRCQLSKSIIGDSPAMQSMFSLINKVMDSNANVFLRGETGTGKELIAMAIHQNSQRKHNPFITQNCAALPENLLESELFGFKRGAFTGADRDKKGLFEAADGGTLFLDEIGDMPINLQAKLLRVIQERTVRPLGTLEDRKVDFRIIAATHHNLEQLVKEGKLREDLYFRLHVFPISIPPLRERKEDLPQLLQHFLKKYAENNQKQIQGFSAETLIILTEYDYPGNIRELQGLIEYAVLVCDNGGYILPKHLDKKLTQRMQNVNTSSTTKEAALPQGKLKEIMQRYEAKILSQYLQFNNSNQTKTAEKLDISRRSLVDKIKRYQLKITS